MIVVVYILLLAVFVSPDTLSFMNPIFLLQRLLSANASLFQEQISQEVAQTTTKQEDLDISFDA